ncbi:MAG: hypothetical protein AAFY71_04905 [Bacteroidota bacterium]
MNKSILFFSLLLLLFSQACDPSLPPSATELLTGQNWRPFSYEAPDASDQQKLNYSDILEEMRITYEEDGTYEITFENGIADTQRGTWSFNGDETEITLRDNVNGNSSLSVEDLQSVSFVYSLEDSIGEVTVFCLAN